MNNNIRELRDATGLSQKRFAEWYGIPLSTLRKWEQGIASPAPYVVQLLARVIPGKDPSAQKIEGEMGRIYFYSKNRGSVSDTKGNEIHIDENPNDVNQKNLALYLDELFSDFYEIQDRFNRDCRFDKTENIQWMK